MLRIGFTLAFLLLTSCSFLERNTIGLFASESASERALEPSVPIPPEVHPETPASISIEQVSPPSATGTGNIELVWLVPTQGAETFIIQYGLKPDNLDHHIDLGSEQIERYEDDLGRPVYRYVVQDIPSDKTVYVAIAARRGDVQTPLSEVREVRP